MSRLSVPKKKWQNILEDFAEQVAAKKFTKVKYETWRQMVRPIKSDYIELYQHNHIIEVGYEGTEPVWDSIVADTQAISYEFSFTLCDNSFGDYLFENWEKIENSLYITLDAIGIAAKPSITGGIDYNNLCASSAKAISGTKVNDCDLATASSADKIGVINGTKIVGYDLDSASSVSNYGVLDISAKDICYNGVSIVDALATKADKSDMVGIVEETIERIFNENKIDYEENKNMKNFNFDFGPVKNDSVRMSIYGMAVKNASGTWVAYDKNTGDIMDVDVFNFEGGKFFYKMPTTINEVRMGDVIIHAHKAMIVIGTSNTGLVVVDVAAGEEKTILPTKSPFGFNFIIRVVSLFDMANVNTATAQNPFGNMLPFFLMNEDKEIDPMMFMLMGNQQFAQNPMMMYFLMNSNKDDKSDKNDNFPYFLFLMNAAVPGNATAGTVTPQV